MMNSRLGEMPGTSGRVDTVFGSRARPCAPPGGGPRHVHGRRSLPTCAALLDPSSWTPPIPEVTSLQQARPHFGASLATDSLSGAAAAVSRWTQQLEFPKEDLMAVQSATDYLSSTVKAAEAGLAEPWTEVERAASGIQNTGSQLASGLAPLSESLSKGAPFTALTDGLTSIRDALPPLPDAGAFMHSLPSISPDGFALPPLPDAGSFMRGMSSVGDALPPLPDAGAFMRDLPSITSEGVADELSGALSAAQDVANYMSGSFASGLSAGPEGWASGLSGAVRDVAAGLSGGDGGEGASLAPHFGTRVSDMWMHAVVEWLNARSQGLQIVYPEALGTLSVQVQQLASDLAAAPAALMGPVLKPLLNALITMADPAALPATMATAASELDASLTAFRAQGLHGMMGDGYNLAAAALAAAGVLALVAATAPSDERAGGGDDVDELSLTHDYCPEVLEVYFRHRPVAVAQRAVAVALAAARFGTALMMDIWRDRVKVNQPARAAQMRQIIESLGPTYVKVAQALSTRVDLLPPAYFVEVQNLQDRVPPFPCEVAMEVMTKTFGRRPETVFGAMSAAPVAAASLGQVYRAVLLPEYGGGEVAVKVQRPDVLEQVALDLYLIRKLASVVPQLAEDWPPIIDNWAVRFFHEMDYNREAASATLFAEQMSSLEGILVPRVRTDLSSMEVLVTDWVEGEKLSESRAADVRELCNTLLTAYLIQLLDTGFLHADPHPGNLIRTPDGKICILDYGLMTEVTPEQRMALVEYIAHLSIEDWPNVVMDLKKLGFIPDSVSDPQEAGLVEPLGRILSQLVGGGGATKLNIDKVMNELEELGKAYPFQIPPFFALILRAFSVIEGIALTVDPDYAIVRECFPYLSRRLLSDDSPRMRKALKDVLYGGKQRLDMERLVRLADGLQAYTTDGLVRREQPQPPRQRTLTMDPVTGETVEDPLLDDNLVEVLTLVFNKRGSYVQELLVDEAVAAADALSREALSELLRVVLRSVPAAVTSGVVASLGPLRPVLLPLPTPIEILSRLVPAVAVTPEDQEALGVVRGIMALAQRLAPPPTSAGQYGVPWSNVDVPRMAAQASVLFEKLSPGILYTGEMFARAFLRRITDRVAASLSLTTEYHMAMTALGMMSEDPSKALPSSTSNPRQALPSRSLGVGYTSPAARPDGMRRNGVWEAAQPGTGSRRPGMM